MHKLFPRYSQTIYKISEIDGILTRVVQKEIYVERLIIIIIGCYNWLGVINHFIYTAEDLKRNALWGVVSNHWRYLTVVKLKCSILILQRFKMGRLPF